MVYVLILFSMNILSANVYTSCLSYSPTFRIFLLMQSPSSTSYTQISVSYSPKSPSYFLHSVLLLQNIDADCNSIPLQNYIFRCYLNYLTLILTSVVFYFLLVWNYLSNLGLSDMLQPVIFKLSATSPSCSWEKIVSYSLHQAQRTFRLQVSSTIFWAACSWIFFLPLSTAILCACYL